MKQFLLTTLIFFPFIFCTGQTSKELKPKTIVAETEIDNYLKTHSYAFSLANGFDESTTYLLKQRLGQYKLILQAEGGSHFLDFYEQLPLLWLKFLNKNFGLTHFFLEGGHSSDLLINKYLETGNDQYIYNKSNLLWESLYTFNSNLAADKKLHYFGIDFESRRTFIKALKLILPATDPPQPIRPSIDLIKNTADTLPDCDDVVNISSSLRKALSANKEQFVQFFGEKYFDFERMILNEGSCKDVFQNRNKNMASSFLVFDKVFNQPIYYGELGEAHTVLINKNTASIINNSQKFNDKVGVVNLYCYNCTTPEEPVSNWPLKKIEKDILDHFLPYCTSDFTLFDLSDDPHVVKKYSAYGAFLIIAKNQR